MNNAPYFISRRSLRIAATVLGLGYFMLASAVTSDGTLPGGTPLSVTVDDIPPTIVGASAPVSGSVSIGGLADTGPDTVVIYVVDISGSANNTLSGVACGQVNDLAVSPGNSNTVLDCEIEALVLFNNVAIDSGRIGDVGVVPFGGVAITADVSPDADVQILTAPETISPASGYAFTDVEAVLRSVDAGAPATGTDPALPPHVELFTPYSTSGATNFYDAIVTAVDAARSSAMPNQVVIFLTDGQATAGGDPRSALNIKRAETGTLPVFHTFAFGVNANCDHSTGRGGTLRDIARMSGGTCTTVSNPTSLPDVLPQAITPMLTTTSIRVDGVNYGLAGFSVPLPQAGPQTLAFSRNLSTNTLSVGSHELCVVAGGTDVGGAGEVQACTSLEVVPPNQLPIADAGPDLSFECNGTSTDAALDGSASSDPDGDALTYSWSGAFGTADGVTPTVALPLGAHDITLTVDDGIAGTASDTVTVTIVDTTAPSVDAGADVTLEATSLDGAPYALDPSASDLCGSVSIAVIPTPPNYPLGDTTVTVIATDQSGNEARDTFVVSVVDTTPPEITAPADITVEATGERTAVALDAATATDIFAVTVTNDAPDDGFALGATTVTWTATDANGNSASAAQVVTVLDTTAPTLTAPADITREATAVLTPLDLGAASATDAADPAPLVTNDAPTGGFPIGATTVTWTATDASGNSATAAQEVTIVDTTPPALMVPLDITAVAAGVLTAVDIGAATATDIFPVTISNDAPEGNLFPLGTTAVRWTATDDNGNSATGTQRVTVTYQFEGFLTPVVSGGIYKYGRTIPVKFSLALADGSQVSSADASLVIMPLGSGSVAGTPLDIQAIGAADHGLVFVFTGSHYRYNLDTSTLPGPGAYRLGIDLHDGSALRTIDIFLR